MTDYAEYWVTIGTAAPVIALAHIVVTSSVVSAESRSKVAAYWLTGIGSVLALFSTFAALGYLGQIPLARSGGIDRYICFYMLLVSFLALLIGSLLAGRAKDPPHPPPAEVAREDERTTLLASDEPRGLDDPVLRGIKIEIYWRR